MRHSAIAGGAFFRCAEQANPSGDFASEAVAGLFAPFAAHFFFALDGKRLHVVRHNDGALDIVLGPDGFIHTKGDGDVVELFAILTAQQREIGAQLGALFRILIVAAIPTRREHDGEAQSGQSAISYSNIACRFSLRQPRQ